MTAVTVPLDDIHRFGIEEAVVKATAEAVERYDPALVGSMLGMTVLGVQVSLTRLRRRGWTPPWKQDPEPQPRGTVNTGKTAGGRTDQ